jgi:hypothetical protein
LHVFQIAGKWFLVVNNIPIVSKDNFKKEIFFTFLSVAIATRFLERFLKHFSTTVSTKQLDGGGRDVEQCLNRRSDVWYVLMSMWRGTIGRLLVPQLSSASKIICKTYQPNSKLFSTLLGNSFRASSVNSITTQSNSALTIIRGFKNPKTKRKSRRTAVKRFIETGNGRLKRAHCGKVCLDPLPNKLSLP